jgi:citrate/tricarballylate utilization protein
MLDPRLFAEADRQLTICNACRYCEGICPVFPALERRRSLLEADVLYLANLCHDCRACVPACPYTGPHEFDINIPIVMAEVRAATYANYTFPRMFARLLARGARTAGAMTVLGVVVVTLLVWLAQPDAMFAARIGPGAFYEVVPWLVMVAAASVATAYGAVVMLLGLYRFWADTEGPVRERWDLRAFASATMDVLLLRQMRGGGAGCAYPTDVPRNSRVIAHQLVFYGFAATFVSTVIAFFYQEFLGLLPPYAVLSLPVVFGTAGGVAQVAGCLGLLVLKRQAGGAPATRISRGLDVSFIVLLLLTNLTGLALLVARESVAMGTLLAVHLGVLIGLFATLPYGKFVHLIYRYAALVRNRREELLEARPEPRAA